MLQKKLKGKKKIKTAKKRKSETDYCMSREKLETWLNDDAFEFWDTAGGKPVKDKTKCITLLEN